MTGSVEHASLQSTAGLIRLRIQLVYPEVVLLQAGMFVAMVWRGLDYVTPPDEEISSQAAIEQAAPFPLWGALFLLAGVAGLLGLRLARWPLAVMAHALGVALYTAFAIGTLISIGMRVHQAPSALALAWIVTLLGAGVVTVAVTYWQWPRYRMLGWFGLVFAVVASIVIVASSSGVYGWRTATGWLFVGCVGHAVMARASADAWKDYTGRRPAAVRRQGTTRGATDGPE